MHTMEDLMAMHSQRNPNEAKNGDFSLNTTGDRVADKPFWP